MLDTGLSLDEIPLAFVDVETTGLRPAWGDRVVEIAVLRTLCGDVEAQYSQLVNPQRPMSPGAFAVNHISDDMLADAPLFAEVAEQVLSLLDGAVLVGHNTPFDLGFLASELGHVGLSMPKVVALDTLPLARSIYPLGSYSLGSICRALGIDSDLDAHRALADAYLTRGLFERLNDDLWRRGVRTLRDVLLRQGGGVHYASPAPLDVPEPLARALQGHHELLLCYRSGTGQETERLVRPLDVTVQSGANVLVAHCRLRNATRTFRLDRILRMEVVESLE
jgi:DNA polymerase-3 subunit epsilon